MESHTRDYSQQGDELSLKALILGAQGWAKYLTSKWFVILLFVVPGAVLGLVYALNQKTNYTAELTFIVEDGKSSPLSAYAGLANQFGIDLGNAGGSGVFTGDNILEFLRSRLLVEKALLKPLYGTEKPISLADYYINVTGMRESWNKKQFKLTLPSNSDRQKFTIQQDSILNLLYESLIKSHLKITKPDKQMGFISVKCITIDEQFSKNFAEKLVDEATNFYVQTKTKKSNYYINKLQGKADSIEFLLNKKTFAAAATQDMNLNPARNMAGVGTELILRDKLVLQTMYGEVIKNLEVGKMALAQETPIIQIIDTPILPLKKEKLGKLKGLILGGFLAGFLTMVFLIIRRIYKQIIQ